MKKISLCLMLTALMGCADIMDKFNSSSTNATDAASYFAKGDLVKAQEKANIALKKNPSEEQAILVAGLSAEASNNPNQAKAYYEKLILLNPQNTTYLGRSDMSPIKVVDLAKQRLRALNIKNSQVIIEDYEGDKVFNIKREVAANQNATTLEQALFAKEKKDVNYTKAAAEANVKAAEILFNEDEKNKITRFLILKELAEENLITKEEFLAARTTNLGALLPLTNQEPAYGLGKPVPSADAIIARIAILKEGVEDRTISSKEFITERNAIIKALLPSRPRVRESKKKPAKDILSAAKDLRKLEVLSELNLVTKKEKDREAKAIETFLGMNQQPNPAKKKADAKPAAVAAPSAIVPAAANPNPAAKTTSAAKAPTTVDAVMIEEIEKLEKGAEASKTPDVSSPF